MEKELEELKALQRPTLIQLHRFWSTLDRVNLGKRYSPADGRVLGEYYHSPASLLETLDMFIQCIGEDLTINPAYLNQAKQSLYFEEWFVANMRYIAMGSYLALLAQKFDRLIPIYKSAVLTRPDKSSYYDRSLRGACNDLHHFLLVLYQVELAHA
jgi:hypothetical protein